MKLYIKREKIAGRTMLVLVDETGTQLPGQVWSTHSDHINEHPEFTVSFLVDGRRIAWWDDREEAT